MGGGSLKNGGGLRKYYDILLGGGALIFLMCTSVCSGVHLITLYYEGHLREYFSGEKKNRNNRSNI